MHFMQANCSLPRDTAELKKAFASFCEPYLKLLTCPNGIILLINLVNAQWQAALCTSSLGSTWCVLFVASPCGRIKYLYSR